MKRVLALLALLLPLGAAAADTAQPAVEDPVLEKRVMALTAELRCLVCQNQSLADSHADLAIDLKNQVRAMMKEGRTDAEIKAFMTERYGDFVLYRPPVKASTWLLWIGPFVLFAVALAAMFGYIRRRRSAAGTSQELTPEQRARARALLESSDAAEPR
jgi:cytochrome c-type biogenesis protein CcmH